MRLPGHEDHALENCEACAIFDQVHAERDDLLLRVAQLQKPSAPKTADHRARISQGVRDWWASDAGRAAKQARRDRARSRRLERLS